MRSVCVIPARFGSTRFPGKPLFKIRGKELICWVLDKVKLSNKINEVLVATDHESIKEVVECYGSKAIMTDVGLQSGSDRIYQAIKDSEYEIVINIQGDEPSINPFWIDRILAEFENNPQLSMVTLAHTINEEELLNLNSVKVICDVNEFAIYFSRFPIPFSRQKLGELHNQNFCLKHIGIYGYRKSFLKKFCDSPQSPIEQAESLEQLRALALGEKIKVIQVESSTIGIDTPEDVEKFEQYLNKQGFENEEIK